MAIRNFASESFGSTGAGTLIPRQKFHFTLVLMMADQAVQFTRVSTATQASYSFDTQIANQYNKKRVVQTKVNYDPITIQFYDTHDNQWHNIWRRYMAFYYNNNIGIEGQTSTEGNETAIPFFETEMGFTPNTSRYFFPQISIIQNGHGWIDQHRETRLINPMITDMRGDTLDYSDSQPVQYSVTFQPESVQSFNVGTKFIVDTVSDPSDFNVLTGGFGDDETVDVSNIITDTGPATIASFDTLTDALTGSNNLPVGAIIDISGVEAVVDSTNDGQRFFIDRVTGDPVQ